MLAQAMGDRLSDAIRVHQMRLVGDAFDEDAIIRAQQPLPLIAAGFSIKLGKIARAKLVQAQINPVGAAQLIEGAIKDAINRAELEIGRASCRERGWRWEGGGG